MHGRTRSLGGATSTGRPAKGGNGPASLSAGTLRSALWSELTKRADVFDEARRSQPAFSSHATALSVLGVLDDEAPESYDGKEELTRSILEAYQTSHRSNGPAGHSSYWTTLLLAAFYPMLNRLRFEIISDTIDRDDLDQLVIESFLKSALNLHVDGRRRLALRLKNRTRRDAFERIRGDWRRQKRSKEVASEVVTCQIDPLAGRRRARQRRPLAGEAESLADLLLEYAGDTIEQAQLDLVIATMIRREKLPAIVARQHPHLSPEERVRVYERIKRKHCRSMARLHELLKNSIFRCPDLQPGGLLPKGNPQEAIG